MGKTFDLIKSALTLVLILVAFMTTAQTAGKEGTLRGFITDANSKEPVLFAAVYLEGTNFSTQTDVNGYYSITKIPHGTYTVVISSVETEELRKEVVIELVEVAMACGHRAYKNGDMNNVKEVAIDI